MNIANEKVGRNDFCPCGSNLKYKKCCLNIGYNNSDLEFIEKMKKAQTKKMLKQHGSDVLWLDSNPNVVTMSEIILKISKEYLDKADTDARRESIISLACMAWNLTYLSQSEHENIISKMILIFKIESYETALREMLENFMNKKKKHYKSINRYILDYQIINFKKYFHLNIVSSMSEEEFNMEHKSSPIKKLLEKARSISFFSH